MMEAVGSFEMLVRTYQILLCRVPGRRIFGNKSDSG
jgi:hypothetical protein